MDEAHNLWGAYDIIARIKADTVDKLVTVITRKIEKIGKIIAELT